MWHRIDTGLAPTRPEIEDHDLAKKRGKFDFLAREIYRCKTGGNSVRAPRPLHSKKTACAEPRAAHLNLTQRMKIREYHFATALLLSCYAASADEMPTHVKGNVAAPQKANARTIPNLDIDLVWIRPSDEAGAPFWLGRTEVTQKQWAMLMKHNLSEFKGDDLPVQNVDWNECMDFCRKLTDKERTAGRLPIDYEFSLPSNAQWEFACRAGGTDDYQARLSEVAWYFLNSAGQPHRVATKQPNAWGLCDMLGNVAEWCLNGVSFYSGAPQMVARSIRGGSWRVAASQTSISFRIIYSSTDQVNTVGFRLALSPVGVVQAAQSPINGSLPH